MPEETARRLVACLLPKVFESSPRDVFSHGGECSAGHPGQPSGGPRRFFRGGFFGVSDAAPAPVQHAHRVRWSGFHIEKVGREGGKKRACQGCWFDDDRSTVARDTSFACSIRHSVFPEAAGSSVRHPERGVRAPAVAWTQRR